MNGEFVNSQCVRCLFADIREPCLNVFKCPVIILFSYTLSCFLCNFRVYSIGQDGESGLCSKAAGLPEGEEAFHPTVAFFALGDVAAFSPLHAEAQGAFCPVVYGFHLGFIQKDPMGVHPPPASNRSIAQPFPGVSEGRSASAYSRSCPLPGKASYIL